MQSKHACNLILEKRIWQKYYEGMGNEDKIQI